MRTTGRFSPFLAFIDRLLLFSGHLAVLLGVAMGAEVTVFTHQEDKVADAKKMGATDVVLTTEKDWAKPCTSFTFPTPLRKVGRGAVSNSGGAC